MKLDICQQSYSLQWGGTYYFALTDYPNIKAWELEKLAAFCAYEKWNHRQTDISCQDSKLLEEVHQFLEAHACAYPFRPSCKLVASTFNINGEAVCCPYLSHTCTVAAALSIFKTGRLLSAVRAFGVTAQELARSDRNAAGDPADYFHYVMLGWSNTTSGYRLAMERLLNRMPNETDLREHFVPGVSFHYSYSDICQMKGYVFDGYHPAKIKDELSLEKLQACIIPKSWQQRFEAVIPKALRSKIHYLDYRGEGLVEWSNRVYQLLRAISDS
ncbi:hypothetical protein [Streptococcus equi]|uniref:hypothetical protein n=1 Tax=Streptococcus equi TaxID=1336 RepID=UPI0005B7AB6F|nr:hypothetical protein [Streptococcus equi]VTP85918.1 phosphate ABC transporter ATPase [Streptococcus equi subsp. zooepidemicus]KIS17933.1 phosphate ABC transporter ATPase [Streptococcus equi subsp. zooepidemicus SzAM35]HEK9996090.1 phosphate ABC transporter ATPase [Streptococcus equi subsp. zooepidemicus]HEL0553405.1 phosphate ABC transporter ATPase [Streptococcus equi subsp. zooepidemicus]HEL0583804.1 phosphate ABC transporter ATPase [Streptococcus equi subsp. zooepidemicus]